MENEPMVSILDSSFDHIGKKRSIWWIAIVLVFFSQKIEAKEIVLFDESSKTVENYESNRNKIAPGYTLIFSKGKKFKVEHLLGCGNTSCIYELADFPGEVLRIPKSTGLYFFTRFDSIYYEDYIDELAHGKSMLDQYQVPSIKIYEDQGREFVRVEKVDPFTDLRKFLASPFLYSESDRLKMEADLIEFAKAVSPFRKIGDFYSDQLHYIKGRG